VFVKPEAGSLAQYVAQTCVQSWVLFLKWCNIKPGKFGDVPLETERPI